MKFLQNVRTAENRTTIHALAKFGREKDPVFVKCKDGKSKVSAVLRPLSVLECFVVWIAKHSSFHSPVRAATVPDGCDLLGMRVICDRR